MIASIRSFAMITSDQFISPAGTVAHPGTFLADIPRESVYSEPYRPFGKMGNTEKLAFSVTALALAGISLPETTGIVLGVPHGSLETDLAYMTSVRDNFPSPALFAATLPSASIAELAIPFKLHGPNRVIAGVDQATVILNALFLLNRGTESVIAIFVDPDSTSGFAAALILDRNPSKFSLRFSQETRIEECHGTLFRSIVAECSGKNHFPRITTGTGTFYINEESHGTAD